MREFGNLTDRKAFAVAKLQNPALLPREFLNRFFHAIQGLPGLSTGSGAEIHGRGFWRHIFKRDQTHIAATSQPIIQDVPRDPVNPNHQIGAALETIDTSENRGKNVLADILSLHGVADLSNSKAVDASEVSSMEFLKSRSVTALNRLNQQSIFVFHTSTQSPRRGPGKTPA